MKVIDLLARLGTPRMTEPPPPAIHGPSIFAELNAFPMKQPDPPPAPAMPTIQFAKSELTVPWDDRYESLLDLADDHAIDISAGCRYGDCGTCSTALLQGAVSYNHRTGITPDQGFCLPCSCRPSTSIILDI